MSEGEYFARLDGGILNLTLEMTEQCNCRCRYCLYSGAYDNRRVHSAKSMSSETVSAALRFYRRHNGKCPEAHVSFYGGEALLAFDRVKRAIEEAIALFNDKPIAFSISTNGLLLTGGVSEWLAAHPAVAVVVTLNGPFHDRYRPSRDGQPTLERILENLDAIQKLHPGVWTDQVRFICNVTSLEQIRPIRDFYKNRIGKLPMLVTGIVAAHGNPAIGRMLDADKQCRGLLWEELAHEYMETGDPFLHVLFRSRFRHILFRPLFREDAPFTASNCLPFLSNCFVSATGELNLCEKNGDMVLGNVHDGMAEGRIGMLMANALKAINRKCRHCWARRLCSVCFAEMDGLLGKNCTIPDSFCENELKNLADDLRLCCEFALFRGTAFDRLYPMASPQTTNPKSLHENKRTLMS